MPKIKVTQADKYFSKCVRTAVNWTCQRCHATHQENSQGLHNAHWHTRGNWGTRFDPDNCAALCYGCHQYIDSHPYEKTEFFEKRLGKGLAQIITEKANRPAYGVKKQLKDITAHYREELKRIQSLRSEGVCGEIKIRGYL